MIRFLQTKGPVQKALLIGFLGIIIVMMVVTLVPGGTFGDTFGGGNPNAVAKVGSAEITMQDVQQQARAMARQQFPKGLPPQLMSFFVQRATDSLIMQNVFLVEAKRLGLDASNAELRQALMHGPIAEQIFPGGNYIGDEAYQAFVQNNFNMTVAQFEDLVKKDLTIRKLRDMVEGSVTVSAADVQEQWRRRATKVKLEYAVVTFAQLEKSVNPNDAELRAYYEKNQQQFANAIPEQRKARYIAIDPTKLDAAKVSNEDLQNYYKSHQDEFRVPDSITARHILIAASDPKQADAAKAKAEDVLKQLRAGGNFAELAKKFSDDPGSKGNGGELGQVRRGQTVPEFEQAAFGAKKGEIVGPVKTQYGFHIIQVQDKTEAHARTLEEVRPQIEPIVARQKAQGAAEQLARGIEAAARTQGLDKAAHDKGLTVTTTDFFSQGDTVPGIGASQQFMEYAFGQKPMSPPTMVPTQGGLVVAQVTEVKPARTPSFDEIKSRLGEAMRRERAQQLLGQKTQELSDKARSLHNLKAAAAQVGATYKTSDFVTPEQPVPELGALANLVDVSTMKPGDISGPIPTGQSGAVIQIVEKQEPAPAEFESAKDSVREDLLQRKRGEVLEVYLSSLRDKMQKDGKIKIYEDRMKQMSTTVNQ